jgi:hypothetical protein
MADGNRGDLRILAVILVAAVVLIAAAVLVGGPLLQEAAAVFAPGIGLRTAAIWGFGVTFGLFILFALAAGDGLIGELQFMLGSFLGFFFVLTLLIAWIF